MPGRGHVECVLGGGTPQGVAWDPASAGQPSFLLTCRRRQQVMACVRESPPMPVGDPSGGPGSQLWPAGLGWWLTFQGGGDPEGGEIPPLDSSFFFSVALSSNLNRCSS